MIAFVIGKLQAWIAATRETYGVDPLVFLVISTVNAPFFYYTMFRLAKAVAKRDTARLSLWATLFLVSVVVPFVYVLFWGHNLPWYVYAAIGLLVAQGIRTLVSKLLGRGSRGQGGEGRGSPAGGGEGLEVRTRDGEGLEVRTRDGDGGRVPPASGPPSGGGPHAP